MSINNHDHNNDASQIYTKEMMEYQILLREVLEESITALGGTDEPIGKGLESIGNYFGVDRIGLILLSGDGYIAKEVIYWNSKKWIYDNNAEFYSLTEFPWLMRQIRSGQIVIIESLDQIPSTAFSEKEYFDMYGIQTFIARPLFSGNSRNVVGFLHLDVTVSKIKLDYTKLSMLSGLEEALTAILQVKGDLAKIKSIIMEKDILLNNTDIQMWYMLNPAMYGSTNEAHAKFLGKTCKEIIHSDIYSVFEMQVADALADITLEVFEKKMPSSREMAINNCHGKERILLINWNPILDDKQEVLHVICSAHDITDLKKTQELLAANRELALMNDKLLDANKELEKEIAERKLAEERLEKAYTELKNAQEKIIQQEKMASIGQLAAGVAHEINNPMGFIISNLSSLKGYTGKIATFLKVQDETVIELKGVCDGEQGVDEKKAVLFQRLQDMKRSQKIDYIMGDTEDLIKETQEGANRVKNIVQDLKGFTRMTVDDSMAADINAGLESTINIIWNELKYKTTLVKDFADLPLVTCNPGQMNQVFMNILLNAVQAIDTQGEIRIKTWSEKNNILVSISDTGCGMPHEVVNRIFEPFFTTKEVGKGTGLGLSISYEIIKNHGGDIKVDSKMGEGTTFTVKIPVEGKC